MSINSIYWFRKSLRLHDNPSLMYAIEHSEHVFPIFILDPYFMKTAKVGPNRWRFLIESLEDLDRSLKQKNSSLLVLKGDPKSIFEQKFKEWNISLLCFEKDSEPYSKKRDNEIEILASGSKVKTVKMTAHTLFDLDFLFESNEKKVCLSYTSMQILINKIGEPPKPVDKTIEKLKPLSKFLNYDDYTVPKLENLPLSSNIKECGPLIYPGGETEGLKRLKKIFEKEEWISNFEKPNTAPNSLSPSTTVLSPYLKFGCISVRYFYGKLKEILNNKKYKNHSKPPVSLLGQLYWREFFYFAGAFTPNFSQMHGNPICKQIPWRYDEEHFLSWKNAKTGYPFIDAIMTQLKQEGWIHHLARHAVACFLTRGDLYISWEKGQEVFEEWLLDADWSLNAANWMWLSASCFFYQYWRVYSPVEFGKKTDKNGDYIKKYLPVLKKMPKEFIYEPWKAPFYVQKEAMCVIGVDYPFPIVEHSEKMKENMELMKKAYVGKKEKKGFEDELDTKTLKKMKFEKN